MRLGVISDTHGHLQRTMDAVRVLESLEVDRLIHCGDIGSPAIAYLLEDWPTDYVDGNVDHDTEELAEAIAASGGTFHGRFADLELAGVRIAVLHSDDARRFRDTIASARWQLVCYGHTHAADLREEQGVWVLNPGALYRTARPSVAIVELPALEIHHVEVSAAGGH